MNDARYSVDVTERFVRVVATRRWRAVESDRTSYGYAHGELAARERFAAFSHWQGIPRHVVVLYAASLPMRYGVCDTWSMPALARRCAMPRPRVNSTANPKAMFRASPSALECHRLERSGHADDGGRRGLQANLWLPRQQVHPLDAHGTPRRTSDRLVRSARARRVVLRETYRSLASSRRSSRTPSAVASSLFVGGTAALRFASMTPGAPSCEKSSGTCLPPNVTRTTSGISR